MGLLCRIRVPRQLPRRVLCRRPLWGGIDSNGIPSRNYAELEAGDKVATYAAKSMKRDDLGLQEEVTVPEGTSDEDANRAKEMPLEDGRYRLQFVVNDEQSRIL